MIRRAQESVELCAKGALLILGHSVRHDHAIGQLRAKLSRVFPVIGFQLTPALEAFVLAAPMPPQQPTQLHVKKVVHNTLSTVAIFSREDFGEPLTLTVALGGARAELRSGSRTFAVIAFNPPLEISGTWTQKRVSEYERDLIQSYLSKLAKDRDASFYLERIADMDEALFARQLAWIVARLVLGAVGYDILEHYKASGGQDGSS